MTAQELPDDGWCDDAWDWCAEWEEMASCLPPTTDAGC